MKRNEELNKQWAELVKRLNTRFDQDFELEGILFMIGLQELNKGYVKAQQGPKNGGDAHCRVYAVGALQATYTFIGRDPDGWPTL